jgi:Cof subfamily protein (haloacid dehalogenase superfamily)
VDRPRLLGLDLDGTLLRSDGTLSDRTRRVLKAVAAAGVEIVVVTARPPRFVAPIAVELDLGAVALCANGAIDYDLGSGKWLAVRPLSRSTAWRVVTSLAVPDVRFAVETGERVVHELGFTIGDFPDVRFAARDAADMFDMGIPIVKLLARSATRDADDLVAAARTAVGDDIEATQSGGRGLLEISAPGVSKVAGLARLCAERGISRDEVMAFGDMPNDLAMLRWAGTGYAVANAHPSVRAAAAHHTASNDEDGVAQVLETLA